MAPNLLIRAWRCHLGMDRPVAESIHKKKRIKWIMIPTVVLMILWGGSSWLFSIFRPSISRSEVRTAIVDRGPVAATIEASGLLLPEMESIISSPIESRILKILKSPGVEVKAGDPILTLDTNAQDIELEKLSEELAIKENAKQQARQRLAQTLKKHKGDREVALLDLKYLEVGLRQKETLFNKGLISKDELLQAQLDVDKKRIELRQLDESMDDASLAAETEINGLNLEIRVLGASREAMENQVERATARADRDGILTWAPSEEGAPVGRGEVIAKIADLNHFKVEASISDFHVGRLEEGLETEVHINQQKLEGHISKLLPSVSDGVLKFHVSLPSNTGMALHAYMRADVFVVTARRTDSLRIKKGPALSGERRQNIHVIRNGYATRVAIKTGVSGVENQEIISGLEEGDEVIISDNRAFAHLIKAPIK